MEKARYGHVSQFSRKSRIGSGHTQLGVSGVMQRTLTWHNGKTCIMTVTKSASTDGTSRQGSSANGTSRQGSSTDGTSRPGSSTDGTSRQVKSTGGTSRQGSCTDGTSWQVKSTGSKHVGKDRLLTIQIAGIIY